MAAMDVEVRDAVDGDVEAMTAIYDALVSTTTIEWRDEPRAVADRRAWQRRQQGAGRLSEIGRKHDRWLDLVLMQRVLDP